MVLNYVDIMPSVPQNIDPNKIFLVNFSELEGRWDPTIFQNQFRFISKQYTNRKLSSVALIDPKVSFSKLKDDDDISFIPMNIVNEDDGTIKESLYKKVLETKGFTRFQDGDLIWAKITPCMQNGKSAVVRKLRNGYGCGSTEFFVIRPKDDTLLIDYVYILLRDNRILQTATNYFGGSAGQQRVSKTFLENLTIPVPPLHIQQKIVNDYNAALSQRKKKLSESKAKLASIDQYLLGELGITLPEDSHEKTFIVNYKDVDGGRLDPYSHKPYFSSSFENIKRKYELFSIKQISSLITSGITPLSGSDAYTNREEGVAFVRSGDIDINGNIDFDNLLYIKHNIHNTIMKSSQVQKNDIMIAIVGATIGRIGIYYSNQPANINQAIALVRLKESFLPDYIKEVLQSSIGQLNLDKMKRPVARANVNLDEIGQIILPIPPLNKQQELADHISAIRAEAKSLEQEANTILEQAKKKVEEMILG